MVLPRFGSCCNVLLAHRGPDHTKMANARQWALFKGLCFRRAADLAIRFAEVKSPAAVPVVGGPEHACAG